MNFTFQLIPLLYFVHIQMPTGLVILQIEDPQLAIVSFLVTLLFHGIVRNKLFRLALVLRLNIELWVTIPSKLLFLQWLLEDMGVSQPSSTNLYCDNQSAIQIAYNDVFYIS